MIKTWYEDGYVNIAIVDTGCGIDEDDLPKVKENSSKEEQITAWHRPSICDEIVTLHGGILI